MATAPADDYESVAYWERRYGTRWLRPVRPLILKRLNKASMDASIRHFARRDPDENAATRLPEGEDVTMPAIWIVELFTPGNIAGLTEGLRRLLASGKGAHRRDDVVQALELSRRRGESATWWLPTVLPPGSQAFAPNHIEADLPAGVAYVRLILCSLTSSVSAIVAGFVLDGEAAESASRILGKSFETRGETHPDGSYTVLDVRSQKRTAVDEWRQHRRAAAERWLRSRLPGSFGELNPDHYPTIELVLTTSLVPWATPDGHGGREAYVDLLGLGAWPWFWKSTELECLRLREDLFRARTHGLVLAGRRADLLAPHPAGLRFGSTDEIDEHQAIAVLGQDYIHGLATRWALTCLLTEFGSQLAELRDLAEREARRPTANDLEAMRRRLLRLGIDNQVVVSELRQFARSRMAWQHDVLDFVKVLPKQLDGQTEAERAPVRLLNSLRASQRTAGRELMRTEANLRELLSTSAALTGAAQNVRLQRLVLWVAIFSLFVALVTTAVAAH